MLPHLDALFGGSAGGGKSYILLANAIQHSHIPGCAALILRRTFTELRQPGALLDVANQWFKGKKGIRYSAEDHTYEFETKWPKGTTFNWEPPPFKLQFGYLGDYGVEQRYQGAQYVFVGVDEAGHFETDIGYDTAWCDKIEYHANFDDMNYSEVREFFSDIVKLNGKVVYYQFGNFSQNKPEEQLIVPDDILQILPEGITNDDIDEIAQVYDELGGNATPVTPSPRTVMDVYTQDHDIHPVVDLTRNVIDLTNDD